MASLLEDLDELTLRCRDAKARLYIGEAVASYRSGAFARRLWLAGLQFALTLLKNFAS